jgi:uncharacterized protein YbjT (DUF2867 family)
MDLYIYYRAHSTHAQPLQTQVQAMQNRLRRDYGVAAALKRRPPAADALDTWMEIYLDVPADFEINLQRAVDDAALAALIDGVRHIENFQDCTSCV